MSTGFHHSEHREAFIVGRARTQRGGDRAQICGARTRTGALCQDLPIKGSRRCIKHCGPKAANAFRERQRRAFLSGKLSAKDWQRAEERRTMNRLRDRWKKDPWLPGVTIDLGEHETRFGEAMAGAGFRRDDLPPAVADWLRWKFRRYQIDRRDGSKWSDVLRVQLPDRLRIIGPRPGPGSGSSDTRDDIVGMISGPPFTVGADGSGRTGAKRQLPDRPKAPPVARPRKQFGRGRPRKQVMLDEQEEAEIAMMVHRHRKMLAPLLANCRSQRDQINVVYALRAYLNRPDDRGAYDRWLMVCRELSGTR